MFLVGQKNNLNIIKNWTSLPNFMIIQGSDHTGKTYFLKTLCKRYNLSYMLIDNKVDKVRNLVTNQAEDANMVYHFKNFHLASNNAKNALLKITEETLPGNHIVITGLKQISTLESRAKKLMMQPYSDEELLEYIDKKQSDHKEIALKLVEYNFKTPAILNRYLECETIDTCFSGAKYIVDNIMKLGQTQIDTFMKNMNIQNNYEKGLDEVILLTELMINMLEKKMFELNNYISYNREFKILFELKHKLLQNSKFKRKLLLQDALSEINTMEVVQY